MAYAKTIEIVRQTLIETMSALKAWFELEEEVRMYKPSDGGWSIQENLEHITLTSHYLLLVIRKGRDKALRRVKQGMFIEDGESDLDRLAPVGQADAFPWVRPEHMEPMGAALDDIRTRLDAQYQDCLSVLESLKNGEGALHTVRMSVQNLGKMDMYQWIYFLVLHQRRHIDQMQRVWQEYKEGREN